MNLNALRERSRFRKYEADYVAARGGMCFVQGDQSIANQAGAAFRSDLNNELQALVTFSQGATVPGTTYRNMTWHDTTLNLKRRRNAANTGWINEGTLDEAFVLSRSSNTILGQSDVSKSFVATAAFTQTFTAAATLADGWWVAYNAGGFAVVLDPNGAELIDGAATKTVTGSGLIYCNGSAFYTVGFGMPAATQITNSLGADVNLNNTANYFDGPSVAQGTSGTWFVSGTVTVYDTAGVAQFAAKLWDGTTVIASAYVYQDNTNGWRTISLSGYLSAPAGNLRISVKDLSSTSGKILFNQSGNSKDSTISAIRIA